MLVQLSIWDQEKQKRESVVTRAEFQNETVNIRRHGQYLSLNWYKYDTLKGKLKPFVGFFNDAICIFSNTRNIKYEDLSSSGQFMLDHYLDELVKNGYSDDFRTLYIPNEKGQPVARRLIWKLADKDITTTPLSKNDLLIEYDGQKSRCQVLVEILRASQEERLIDLVYEEAQKMGISDQIHRVMIEVPLNKDWYYHEDSDQDEFPYNVGVDGVSYTLQKEAKRVLARDRSTHKCLVLYSPLIYLLCDLEQRSLIVHELCHVAIGYEHGHDRFFWYMFEVYSGLTRQEDSSYRPDEEEQDSAKYEAHSGETCDECIARHKRYLGK